MKRIEILAWSALTGLLVIASILFAGGFIYSFSAYWAGMLLVLGQALVVGLMGWGMMLARQAAELRETGGGGALGGSTMDRGTPGGFRMTVGGDEIVRPEKREGSDAKTLDTGFQRFLTGAAGVVLVLLAVLTARVLIYSTTSWAGAHPDQPFPIAGSLPEKDKPYVPLVMDELSVVIGLGAAGIYAVLYWMTRTKRNSYDLAGETLHGVFLLGLSGAVALAAASVLGYLKVTYASELAAGVIAGLMGLQGLELLVNSMRSYSGIEELDQEPVDLHAQPLVPMLGSVWLSGLRMLFAQSLGLSGDLKGERGVMARMMPRALGAIVVIAILVSCIRVVRPGEVAIRERLGSVELDAEGRVAATSILQPGMHLTLPWPIDELVRIPTVTLRFTKVGPEFHKPVGSEKMVDFQFWTVRTSAEENEEDSEFVTGDPGSPQLLETFVGVWWRVSDPSRFYTSLSHNEFYEKNGSQTTVLPIYEAMVKQSTMFAVTRTFAIHTLDQIMVSDRPEVERHCRRILQDKLNEAGTGIEIVDLTIKDLHPPYWQADMPDATAWAPDVPGLQLPRVRRGPASAFENVINMRELMEMLISRAEAEKKVALNQAHGQAQSEKNEAETYKTQKISTAQGEAGRLVATLGDQESLSPEERSARFELLKSQARFRALSDEFEPVMNKILVDPRLDVELYLLTEKGAVPLRPGGTP